MRSCSVISKYLLQVQYYKLYLFPQYQYRYVFNWISPAIHYSYPFIDCGFISGFWQIAKYRTYVTSYCVLRRAWSCSSGKQRRPARRSWRRPPAAWGPRSCRRSGSRNPWEEHRSEQRASVFPFSKYLYIIIQSTTVYVLSSELGLPQPLSCKRVCPPPPGPKAGGAHSPAAKWVGEFQFGRLEKKLSTLPTLWASKYCTIFRITRQTFYFSFLQYTVPYGLSFSSYVPVLIF